MKKLTIGFCAAMILLTGAVITACQSEEEGFGGSSSTEVADRIASLESQVASLQQSISSLKAASEASESTLREELEAQKTALETAKAELQKEIDAITNVPDFSGMLDRLEALEKEKAEIEGDIAAANAKIELCETAVATLNESVENIQALVEGKVDTSDYKDFVAQTNQGIQDNAQALSVLQALCDGFEEGEKVKTYIDKAVGAVTSQLGSYVLEETYTAFLEEYGPFKTQIEADVAGNKAEIEALRHTIEDLTSTSGDVGDLVGVEERIVELNRRIDSLVENSLTLEKVQEQFDKSNEDFLNGVNGIIEDALDEGGFITDAINKKAAELQADYQKKIDELSGRVDTLEGQVDALLKSIQSLVYVPKTADGKIHIGTSYIAEIGAQDPDAKIEVTSTKKLEYRISPANLRDAMILLYEAKPDAFSFWQEHVSRVETKSIGLRTLDANAVTRAGEPREGHDGLHEFNIVKLERGNSDGTLLITVDNEHDFTHEDLAVSLCIRYEASGVLTEYSSAYTPVVSEGSNLIDRFYLAKKDENGNYTKVSRTDRIDYTLVWSDRTQIELMEGYEVVYDNGETVMSLEDAKAKYEWDAELTGSVVRTNPITGTEGTLSQSCYTLTNSNELSKPLKFALTDKCTIDNLGASWNSKSYGAQISKKDEKPVTIVSEVQVYVTVVPETYKVSAAVTWNLGNFYHGLDNDWQSETSVYTTSEAQFTYSNKNGEDTPAGNLPSNVYKSLFADGHTWTLTDPCDSLKTNGSLTVTSKVVGKDLAFSVKGFVWCEDTHHITMSRTGNNTIPTSGAKSITVTGTLDFVGPSANDLKVSIGENNPILMPTKADSSIYKSKGNGSSFALLYLASETSYSFIPAEKVLPLNKKFFSSDIIFYTNYTKIDLTGVACEKQTDEVDSPQTLKLEYYTKTGSRPMPILRSINVKNEEDSKISEITQETTYKTDKPFNIVLGKDDGIGPTITVESVTFKVVPAATE